MAEGFDSGKMAESFLTSLLTEQPFLWLMIIIAVIFDVILIVTFIFSCFYDACSVDAIADIISPIADIMFFVILGLMVLFRYLFNKIEHTMAPIESPQEFKKNALKKAGRNEEGKDAKSLGDGNKASGGEKEKLLKGNSVAITKSADGVTPAGASTKPQNSSGKATSATKSAGNDAASMAVSGGIQSAEALVHGDVKEAGKVVVKTGVKISWYFITLGIIALIRYIPYVEVLPWYTAWALWVWWKVTFHSLRSGVQQA